jgi:hypothetical protein
VRLWGGRLGEGIEYSGGAEEASAGGGGASWGAG